MDTQKVSFVLSFNEKYSTQTLARRQFCPSPSSTFNLLSNYLEFILQLGAQEKLEKSKKSLKSTKIAYRFRLKSVRLNRYYLPNRLTIVYVT